MVKLESDCLVCLQIGSPDLAKLCVGHIYAQKVYLKFELRFLVFYLITLFQYPLSDPTAPRQGGWGCWQLNCWVEDRTGSPGSIGERGGGMKPGRVDSGLSAWRGVTPGGHAAPCSHSQPSPSAGRGLRRRTSVLFLTCTPERRFSQELREGSREGGPHQEPPRCFFKPCSWTGGPFPD